MAPDYGGYSSIQSGPDDHTCGSCGAHVSMAFVRVFGNNDDEVYTCPRCSTHRAIHGEVNVPSSGAD